MVSKSSSKLLAYSRYNNANSLGRQKAPLRSAFCRRRLGVSRFLWWDNQKSCLCCFHSMPMLKYNIKINLWLFYDEI